MAKKQKKQSNNDNSYPILFNLVPPLGCGGKDISYEVWGTIMKLVVKERATKVEVGIWGAYTLGRIIDGVSLTTPVVIAKNEFGDDIVLEFNPSCGKMIRFDGTELIKLLPGEMEEIMFR